MNFVEKLLSLLKTGFEGLLNGIVEFLSQPLGYLLMFLEALLYFFTMLFQVLVEVVMLFVACFQFVGALIAGIFRTIQAWLTINPNPNDLSFPSVSNQGFQAVTEILQGTGLLTVVPLVATAFVWFYFVIKIIGLFGGNVVVISGGSNK